MWLVKGNKSPHSAGVGGHGFVLAGWCYFSRGNGVSVSRSPSQKLRNGRRQPQQRERIQSRDIADPAGHRTRTRRRIPTRIRLPASCPRAARWDRPSAVSVWAKPSSTFPPTSIRISAASQSLRSRRRAGSTVEEAYFQTLALPRGFTLKGGRFFSGIGYLNEQHQHAWDFQDAPLVYKAFLGNQLKQDGLQLKWIAPTDLLIELGAEASSGDQFPGSDRNKNGIGGSAVFANIGGDIGASTAWRVGASYLSASPNGRSYQDVDALGGPTTNTFTGNAKLAGVNGVIKWAPNGNATYYNFKLQGEYFRLKQNGAFVYNDAAGSNVFGQVAGSLDTSQSGWYTQAAWQFHPQWRVGYRYDRLNYSTLNNSIVTNGLGPTAADFPVLANHSPTRNTLMFDWSPTEFSRIRLQYASDKSRLGLTDNQLFVQYIYSMGAHGAHKF